jgi:hypothetical protein
MTLFPYTTLFRSVTTRWQNKLQLVQRMAKLEKGEDKLINGDLSGTSPKLSRWEHARVTRNQTGDLVKSEEKMRIHKIPAYMESLYVFLCPKERKLRVPNEAHFSDRLGTAGYPMTFRTSHILPLDKYLFWFLNMKDVYLPSEIWDITWSLPPPIIWKSLRPIRRRHSTFEHTDQCFNHDVTPEEKNPENKQKPNAQQLTQNLIRIDTR